MSAAMLVVIGMLMCSHSAMAHGGGLHRWTTNADVRNIVKTADVRTDVHQKIGACSEWTVLNTSAISPSVFFMPWFAPVYNMTVSGSVDIVSYLVNNCTGSFNTALIPFLNFRIWLKQGDGYSNRAPPAGLTTFAYGYQGSCAAPGNLYRNNVSLADNRFNLAWWGAENEIGNGMNTSDYYPGWQWGAAPQSWVLRNSTAPDRMQSIVLFAQNGPTFCCNVNYTGYPAPDAVLKEGHDCAVDPGHGRKLHKNRRKAHSLW